MKAAVCYEFGKPLVIEEITLAAPKAGEVRVKIKACAICHSDMLYASGAWGGSVPAIFGHEAAGVVEAIGEGVSRLSIGDHVVVNLVRACGLCFFCSRGEPYLCETKFALDTEDRIHDSSGTKIFQGLRTGAFAEATVVDQSQAVKIPEEIPLDAASLLACGVITGLGAVMNTAKIEANSSVVVVGTGGVGLNSIQGAALAGANPIIAVDLSPDKLAASMDFGATHAVSADAGDVGDAVRYLTDGRGADYVFVAVGAEVAIEQGFGLIRPGGTLVLVGMPAEGTLAQFEPLEFASANRTVLGSKMGSSRPLVDIPRLVEQYEAGHIKLDELITNRYPLEQINEAITSVERGEALRNVIVF